MAELTVTGRPGAVIQQGEQRIALRGADVLRFDAVTPDGRATSGDDAIRNPVRLDLVGLEESPACSSVP